MRVCVIAPGVVHATPRTLAFCGNLDDVHFIDMAGVADQGKLESAGIKYYCLDQQKYSRIRFLNLQKLLRAIGPDVIVCHFCSGMHFFNAIAYGRTPVAGIAMGSDILYARGDKKIPKLRQLLIRMGLRRTMYISAKSEYLLRKIRQLGARCPIAVNYWGADIRRFTPTDQMKARRKMGLPGNVPIIISPRTLSPLYSIDVVIDAMPEVIRQEPGALLLILGRAVPEYKNDLEKQIISLGLRNNVRIIGNIGFDHTW